MGYSLQAPAKQNEGAQHPDRDAQFEYLNRLVSERLAAGDPVISVDTKKKELIRPRAQKWFLARLAAETGLEITIVHYPPGTSKWNKIEHRLFSLIAVGMRQCGHYLRLALARCRFA